MGRQGSTTPAASSRHLSVAREPVDPEQEWEFFCECGCFTLVTLTITAFDGAANVWVEGHGERLLSA